MSIIPVVCHFYMENERNRRRRDEEERNRRRRDEEERKQEREKSKQAFKRWLRGGA